MLLLCVRCVVLCASIICVYVRVYVCIPLDILEHSCKKLGRAFVLSGEVIRRHSLFIIIDSNACWAYRLPFHGIEGLPFDGILAVLRLQP